MSLLTRLRAETRVEHDAIEAVFPLARPDLDTLDVARGLRRVLGFYEPLERALALAPWSEGGARFRRSTQGVARSGGPRGPRSAATEDAVVDAARATFVSYRRLLVAG